MSTTQPETLSVASANGSKADNGRVTGEKLNGDKATRIVDAMRKCVANYGAAGATFEHVSKEAGVSRGLLHYYFGTKERLMIEVVRRETDHLISMVDLASESAESAEQLVEIVLLSVSEVLKHEPEIFLLGFEMIGEAQRHPELKNELSEHSRRAHAKFAELIKSLEEKGAIRLTQSANGPASALLAMANGLAFAMLQDPEGDHQPTIDASVHAALCLLGAECSE